MAEDPSRWTEDETQALHVAHMDVITYAEAFYLYLDCLRGRALLFRVPIITLSAITSGVSFAFAALPSAWHIYFQVCIGTLSLIVTILTGLEGYLRLPVLTVQTEKTVLDLAHLAQEIYAVSKIRPSDRAPPGDSIRSTYAKLGGILAAAAVVPAAFLKRHERKIHNGFVSQIFAKNEPLAAYKRRVAERLAGGEDPRQILFEVQRIPWWGRILPRHRAPPAPAAPPLQPYPSIARDTSPSLEP